MSFILFWSLQIHSQLIDPLIHLMLHQGLLLLSVNLMMPSAEEETENQADEEDEEAQEEKDNNEAVVKWTADDQKNLMDLGSSELERNQRLENLIAKRRARSCKDFKLTKTSLI
ncbi:hypothetical protein IEQ34_017351 [Dendrobium chrysotoxum]|uniref:Uncharacterized protein n=1 Tax=Dendrobium chrysotoxum TaxID=161865 RepID=A0AAV7G9W6_DENCH|nr:hypothetical protein IEQ34_017351 [Dendrobium chrysotoxum]